MKKYKRRIIIMLILVFILEVLMIFIARDVLCQNYRFNISGVYASQDNAIGLKAGLRFSKYALYSGFSHGNFSGFDYYNQPFYIRDHYRVSAGVEKYLDNAYLCIGLVYHSFGDCELTSGIDSRALGPVSFEYGAGCSVNRFKAGFRFDPFKWTGRVDLGINLFKLKY